MPHSKSHISEVVYNQELDIYDVLLFGSHVMSYADESIAFEHSMTLFDAYVTGRRDIVTLLEKGILTPEQIIHAENVAKERVIVRQEFQPKPFVEGDSIEVLPDDLLNLGEMYSEDDAF